MKRPFGKLKKRETFRVRTPNSFKRNSQEKDPSTFEGRSHQVVKWRVEKKAKGRKVEEISRERKRRRRR